jgi:hypothetical protein
MKASTMPSSVVRGRSQRRHRRQQLVAGVLGLGERSLPGVRVEGGPQAGERRAQLGHRPGHLVEGRGVRLAPGALSAATFCATSVWCRTAAGRITVAPDPERASCHFSD